MYSIPQYGQPNFSVTTNHMWKVDVILGRSGNPS